MPSHPNGPHRGAERYDVVVIGARCAGSPLATLLARQGVNVAVVEQARFPRDTLSTHLFEADATAFLHRLGVTDKLRATGAPFVQRTDNRLESVRWSADWPQQPGDVAGIASVRRLVLDPILAQAAEEAGAEIRMGTKATGLLRNKGPGDEGRVVGVRVAAEGGESELRARLVVGADGRNSTIAGLCGARKYNLTPNRRALYYTYFEGAEIGEEPTFVFHRWADRMVLACPTDAGLYLVLVLPELRELDRFRAGLEARFMDHARSCEPVASAVAGAKRVGKFFGIVRWGGFFREPAGPGWALVGDAGHFKDPAAGRGIGDAFCQVDALAPAILAGLEGSDSDLDQAIGRWGRWRDEEFTEYYWFGTDLGRDGPVPAVLPEIVRALQREGKAERLLDVMNHRIEPSKVLTPPRLLGAVARLLARGGERRRVLREVAALGAEEIRRRRLNRRPVYGEGVGPEATTDAAPTGVGASEVIAQQ